MVRLLLSFVVLTSSVLSWAQERPCRSLDFVRVENASQLERLKDVCEIRQSLAVFTQGIREITLPRLKSVGLINIESDGLEAIAFPRLESARDIYFSGDELRVIELPQLKTVSARFVVQEQNLEFLNLPELTSARRLILKDCYKLEFVFAEKLQDVASLRLENNPALNPMSAEKLKSVTRPLTKEEESFITNAQEKMRQFRLRLIAKTLNETPIRPTGHHTSFDSYGFIKSYYEWYPYEYSRYWDVIGPWGYTFFYRF
jgi:hypothetical protein